MTYPVSAFCFTRNTFKGGWPLFESMANALAICDEVVVMDVCSDDNTLEVLEHLAGHNHRIRIMKDKGFPEIDAGVFATLPNIIQKYCKNENLMYFQSDEVWHENLLRMTEDRFKSGEFNLSFWRYHLRENAQLIRQFPQRVHRVGRKGRFNFRDDGMNTDKVNDAPLCSNFHGGWFPKWGDMFESDPPYLPTWEMILDGGLIGMFYDCVYDRKLMHEPFWRDGFSMPFWDGNGKEQRCGMADFINFHKDNPNWTKKESPFNIPKLMKKHLGETKYYLTSDVKDAIIKDKCYDLIFS